MPRRTRRDTLPDQLIARAQSIGNKIAAASPVFNPAARPDRVGDPPGSSGREPRAHESQTKRYQ